MIFFADSSGVPDGNFRLLPVNEYFADVVPLIPVRLSENGLQETYSDKPALAGRLWQYYNRFRALGYELAAGSFGKTARNIDIIRDEKVVGQVPVAKGEDWKLEVLIAVKDNLANSCAKPLFKLYEQEGFESRSLDRDLDQKFWTGRNAMTYLDPQYLAAKREVARLLGMQAKDITVILEQRNAFDRLSVYPANANVDTGSYENSVRRRQQNSNPADGQEIYTATKIYRSRGGVQEMSGSLTPQKWIEKPSNRRR